MDFAGLLESLALDAWYKAFVYVGLVLFVVGLTVDVRGVTNGELLLFATGIFVIGIGEWKNHKTLALIKPPNVYTGGEALWPILCKRQPLVIIYWMRQTLWKIPCGIRNFTNTKKYYILVSKFFSGAIYHAEKYQCHTWQTL